jgi:hypothetical protein
MAAWILSLMLFLQPSAPWRDTFPATAEAISVAAHEAPIFTGRDAVERTAAQLVALMWFESRFDPNAAGDHGQSLGLAQIGVSNLHALGLTREQLFDPATNTRAALRMMQLSFVVCRVHPKEERLAHYAAGGDGCTKGIKESVHRTQLAARLLRDHPVFWSEATPAPSGSGSQLATR